MGLQAGFQQSRFQGFRTDLTDFRDFISDFRTLVHRISEALGPRVNSILRSSPTPLKE